MSNSSKNKLFIVGAGVKFFSHLTMEAVAHIKEADIVMYLVNDPSLVEWIQKESKFSENLESYYWNYENRADSYEVISQEILSRLEYTEKLCVIFYGHPTMYCMPSVRTIKIAKEKGYQVEVLPGISAEAMLYADLNLDPGVHGVQSYDASYFLSRRCVPELDTNLILWQIGALGNLGHQFNAEKVKELLNVFISYMTTFYPSDHEIIIYEAASFPHVAPIIESIPLIDLPKAEMNRVKTLYVPPLKTRPVDLMVQNLFDR